MGGMSIWHWLIVAVIILLLFGKGRISEMMGDLGKGIKSFKSGMAEDDLAQQSQAQQSQMQRQVTQAPTAPPSAVHRPTPADVPPPGDATRP